MKRYLPFIILTALILLFAGTPSDALAQNPQDTSDGYQLLVNDLPFVSTAQQQGGGLERYLSAFFQLGLAIAVLLSVVIFTYNGVLYMTSDVIGKKGEAKSGMQSAILGLVLAFSAWLILRTINPSLVDFKLFDTLAEIREEVSTPPPAPPTATTTGSEAEMAAREAFKAVGVGINNSPCPPGSNGQGCTNVVGLDLIRPLFARIAADLGGCSAEDWDAKRCVVTITGGTEPGHKTHEVGRPIADLRFSQKTSEWVARNARKCSVEHSLGPVWVIRNEQTYFLDEVRGVDKYGNPTPRHWHVCVKRGNYCTDYASVCQTVAEN
ncbi:MAG: hypothetical protein AMXMBFR44_2750 [Candidatus Campbellbacteria bacterium]